MIRAGDGVAVEPSGRYLLVSVREIRWRLFRLPLDGGAEEEINPHGADLVQDTERTLSQAALSTDGRLLLSLQPRDSWFNPPGLLDTATGRITRLPSDDSSDYHAMAWLPDGQIAALHYGLNATLWRFQPTMPAR